MLKRLENIPSRDPSTREINLVDVDANIGHVLIHFLHTGVYQTLSDDGIEDSDNSIVRNEFKKAVLTLEAAEKYSVPGLKKLAQIELERRGKEMCLRDAVRAIREAFIAGPPDKHAWLRDYVSKKVQWTFENDPSALTAPDFFESIESPTLTRLLARLIVGLYSDEVEQLREVRVATGNAPAKHQDPTVEARKLKVKLDTEAELKEEKEQLRLKEGEVTAAAAEDEEAELKTIDEEEAAAAVEAEEAEMRKIEEEEAEQMRIEEEEAELRKTEEEEAATAAVEAELRKIEEDEAAAAAAAAEQAEQAELRKIEDEKAVTAVANWGNWRSAAPTVTDKKKAKKAERIRLREEEERLFEEEKSICLKEEEATAAAARAEEAELKKREEEEANAAAAKVCVSDFNARIEKGATLDDDDCGSRLEHLSRNEGWQNCKPCELYMRKIAIKLHSVGLPIVSGLSTID